MNPTRQSIKFVPIVTTMAGSCLTLANWQALGIETFSFDLKSLLIKPGLAVLQTLPNLRNYLGWQGTLILNANSFDANLAYHQLRSPFDGSLSKVQREELLVLIDQLQADRVIYDHRVDANFPYFEYKDTQGFSDFIKQINAANAGYIKGDFGLAQLPLLNPCAIAYLESDRPAKDALQGVVYSNGGLLNLRIDGSQQQVRLDENCPCPVCHQGYTKAYLHHLFAHTPLLCQRFLIQHNVTYYQKQLIHN